MITNGCDSAGMAPAAATRRRTAETWVGTRNSIGKDAMPDASSGTSEPFAPVAAVLRERAELIFGISIQTRAPSRSMPRVAATVGPTRRCTVIAIELALFV